MLHSICDPLECCQVIQFIPTVALDAPISQQSMKSYRGDAVDPSHEQELVYDLGWNDGIFPGSASNQLR
jgi:hypothetical protein